MNSFRDRVIVITGAGSGIGRSLALGLASESSRLYLVDIDRESLEEVESETASSGAGISTCLMDCTDPSCMKDLADRVFDEEGRVDILFNNAGVCGGGGVDELSIDDWKWVIDINLMAVIYGIHSFVPGMIRQGGGHIVNTASLSGLIGFPYTGPYTASKFAVVGLGETLSSELCVHNIHVTTVCASAVSTDIVNHSRIRLPGNWLSRVRRMIDTRGMSPDTAAEKILKAVKRKKKLAIISPEIWPLWILKRMSSALFLKLLCWFTRRSVTPGKHGQEASCEIEERK